MPVDDTGPTGPLVLMKVHLIDIYVSAEFEFSLFGVFIM